MKEFADDNFKFDKNGRKLSKQVENTVGKGEIARYEQFLLFPQCFQKAFSPGRQKVSLCGNGLKHRPLTRTKFGSHSSYVKHQEDFERLHHMKPCKTCKPWQSIQPYAYNLHLFVKAQ